MAIPYERIDTIVRLWQTIYNDWIGRRRPAYTVRPDSDLAGKSVEELKKITFWVGVHGVGENLSAEELASLRLLMKDQIVKVGLISKAHPTMTNLKVDFKVSYEPSDEDVLRAVASLPALHLGD